MLYILFCNFLVLPVVYGSSNVTLASIEHVHNKNLSLKHTSNELPNNKTKIPIISEGGSLLPEIPLLTSSKDNVTVNLLTIDEELAKTKEKPIQARKGVGNPGDDIVALPKNMSNSNKNVTIQNNTTENIKKNNHLNATGTSTTSKGNITPNTLNASGSLSGSKTEDQKSSGLPKKPLVLSYETLSNIDHSAQAKIPAMKSSSKTIVIDQMPSPNKDVRTQSDAFAHTGMVTPIVITILVVPMFALLGYMALRRGQEAWNNRHYKRVDFLLDGMYND